MSNKNKGILLILISSLGFSAMTAFVKLSGDLPSIQKTFFRNAISMVIAFSFVVYYKERWFGKKENQKVLLLRSLLGTLGIVFFFYAIDHLVLSDADMLNKLSPFLVIVFSAIFLKEKPARYQVIALIVALLGTLFIIKPQFSVEMSPYLIGILSAVFAGGAYTVLRVLGNREKYYTVVFYFSFFSTVILLPIVVFTYEPMSITQTVYLLLAGCFATVGQFGITLAYKFAPAKEISIFSYSTVVFAALLSILFFDTVPDVLSIAGYVIVFVSMIYMFRKDKRVIEENKE